MKPGVGIAKKIGLRVLAGMAAVYAAATAWCWINQDAILYHPSTDVVAPTQDFVDVVSLTAEDLEQLVAWHSEAAPGCPTVLFLDGNGGRPEIQEGRWRRMHEVGVGFLAVYYRGYSGSTGAPSEAGFHLDAKAGLDWLEAQGVPASQIVVHGYSIGSGPATKLAAENDVGALVLEAPYYSMLDLLQTRSVVLPVPLMLRSTFRSDTWIGKVSEPVMMAHGSSDGLIPQSQSRRLFALAHEPKTYVSMPGSDHATLVRDGLYDHVWPFLAANIHPTIPPSPACTLFQKAAVS